MLTPEDMAALILAELDGVTTVFLSPAIRAALELPSGVQRVDRLGDPVELAVIAAERVRVDGGLDADALPLHAERTVAILSAPLAGHLLAEPSPTDGSLRFDRLITREAVIDRTAEGLRVREVAEGISAADVQRSAPVPLLAGPDLGRMHLGAPRS